MRGTILQPTYLPWLGYFEMIDATDIFVVFDHVQFVKYTKGSFYDWHNDSTVSHNDGEEGIRKLSCVVQLSPPEAYNGGEFQLYKGCMGEETPAIKKQGSVIVFDARDYHRVTEITEGCRFSLILWARGPNFI